MPLYKKRKEAYMKKDKNKQKDDWDDGRTVSPMSAEWMPWNHGMKSSRQSKKENRNSFSEDTDKKQKIELKCPKTLYLFLFIYYNKYTT